MRWLPENLSVKRKDITGIAARDFIRGLASQDWKQVANNAAKGMLKGPISKFPLCMPLCAENQLMTERLLDVEETVRFLEGV